MSGTRVVSLQERYTDRIGPFSLTASMFAALEAAVAERGITLTAWVREAVSEKLEREHSE